MLLGKPFAFFNSVARIEGFGVEDKKINNW